MDLSEIQKYKVRLSQKPKTQASLPMGFNQNMSLHHQPAVSSFLKPKTLPYTFNLSYQEEPKKIWNLPGIVTMPLILAQLRQRQVHFCESRGEKSVSLKKKIWNSMPS